MVRRYFLLFPVLTALSAAGAEVAGKWHGRFEVNGEPGENTFEFKVDGEKLTGTVTSSRFGPGPIVEGVVKGDQIRFAVLRNFQGQEFKLLYSGKVEGDILHVSIEVEGNQISFDARRVK